MCNFWTCIIDRNLKVHYDGNSSSHETIVENAGLEDDKLDDRDFVRVEITPPKPISADVEKWTLKVDEEKTLPNWFERQRSECEARCKSALKQYLKKCHFSEVVEFIDSLKKIRWFSAEGKTKKGWKVFYGKTWDAARDAAGGAAWDATWDAAGGAARNAALRARTIIVSEILDKKYIRHAKARMEVWARGYGLRYDVNGILYVYAIEKGKSKDASKAKSPKRVERK